MEAKLSCAREAAFSALLSCEKQGAWSDQAIRSAARKWALSARDAALASNLCYGVMQNQLLLDFWIDAFSTTPAARLNPEVRLSLRMALYQLRFLDRIPPSAAVNEAVGLVRKYTRNKGAAGLTNAVLRSFQRADTPPEPAFADPLQTLSVRYSHPLPLVQLLSKELDGDVEQLLEADNVPTDTVIQCNPLKTSVDALRQELERSGVVVQPHPWLSDCLLVHKSGNLEELPAFQRGEFYVQDAAAKLCAMAAAPQSGDKVLDACAAPGGKSFAVALAMQNQGSILSRDLHEKKLKRIQSGAKRLGIEIIETAAADARQFQPKLEHAFDLVIADVPCSGLGIIRKKPDIRYKDLKETENLPEIQRAILSNLARYVRPGGTLVYSTCTVLRRENQDVVADFLAEHSDYAMAPFALPGPCGQTDGEITLWPHIHGTDGFFIAKLRRTNGEN